MWAETWEDDVLEGIANRTIGIMMLESISFLI